MARVLEEMIENRDAREQVRSSSESACANLQSHDSAVLSIAVIRLDCVNPLEALDAIHYGATSERTAEQLHRALDYSTLEYALSMVEDPKDVHDAVDFVNLLGSSEDTKRHMRVAIANHVSYIHLD